ncbi:MAG: M28 family peptidase, partial [Actinomycetota bacterium]|nr:M28 family peptidase [Actinomycetota bacterium]
MLALGLLAGVLLPASALAAHAQPVPQIGQMDYAPIGKYGPADEQRVVAGQTGSATIPATNGPIDPTAGRKFNPSGKFVAYDTNVFESLTLPYRAAGDTSDIDPAGNGGGQPEYGKCNPAATPDPDGFAPLTLFAGRCPNHQLEYLDYYEETMKEILGPFGVTVKRYKFSSPGSGNTKSGDSYNVAAVVPGADHPEDTVIVSGHYDQTTEGPASSWDSAEGHAQVIRMAKIMADYWRATGTRPSATIKFAPWDQEESGLLGSTDYVENNIPPGEEDKVRGYFNVDPCAGAYPAYYRGNPADRVPLTMQLVNPEDHADDPEFVARVNAFNARAETVVDQVMENVDDDLTTVLGEEDIFVADSEATAGSPSQRDEVQTALGGLLLFTSDYSNFEEIGVPFFNFGPGFFGPSANGEPNRQDGIALLHTPNDNLPNINRLTSADPSGLNASEGWAKGMEFCAQVESWYMLQPEMAGGQTAGDGVVAYYEALPNEAIQNENITFDASGSYEYTDVASRALTDDLTYEWSFGDGTTATGKTVTKAYAEIGKYPSRLTVTSKTDPSQSDTMEIPITVIGSNFQGPVLSAPDQDADGTFPLTWEFEATRDGFQRFDAEESTDFRTLLTDDAEAGPDRLWSASDPEEDSIEPWQESDSSTQKFRGNQRNSGARSFWTGVQPQNFKPAAEVQSGDSILTLNQPIDVPAVGDPTLDYWSLFQNEGDDRGRVEVAVAPTGPGLEPDWQPVDVIFATSTAAGGPPDRAVCNPSEASTFTTFLENRSADLGAYRGERLLVRFVYSLGAENRALSQPCGWYVDDVRVSAGEFTKIGETAEQSFEVRGRPAGGYAYRVLGVYA